MRFPIDPSRVLLLSWAPQPDLDSPVSGALRHAADVNRSTAAQADRDWFYRPGTRPPFLGPPVLEASCAPISYDLVPGYSLEAAMGSQRRAGADGLLRELIADGETNALRFVVVKPSQPEVDI